VKFIGLGETPADIETFDPERFVDALFGAKATQPA
jgi:signal recognition particle GTPase